MLVQACCSAASRVTLQVCDVRVGVLPGILLGVLRVYFLLALCRARHVINVAAS